MSKKKYSVPTSFGLITRETFRTYSHVVVYSYTDPSFGRGFGFSFAGSLKLAQRCAGTYPFNQAPKVEIVEITPNMVTERKPRAISTVATGDTKRRRTPSAPTPAQKEVLDRIRRGYAVKAAEGSDGNKMPDGSSIYWHSTVFIPEKNCVRITHRTNGANLKGSIRALERLGLIRIDTLNDYYALVNLVEPNAKEETAK